MAQTTNPFPLTGNILGLPNGSACCLGAVGGAEYLDAWISIAVVTGAAVVPEGTIALYLVLAQEAGAFTDGIDPNSGMDQSAKIGAATQANLIHRLGGASSPVPLAPNSRYSFNDFSVKTALGGTPPYWSPLILNLSGDHLHALLSPYAAYTLQT